ncbi:methyltransferase domain-containing protein [Fibrobacterales bacterium]|nr:methyltransferase domain-containing protein [Fibrobacterales bacterium]
MAKAEVSKGNPRKICLSILKEWGQNQRFIHEHPLLSDLNPSDRAWIRHTCVGVLKNLNLLDFWIKQFSQKKAKSNIQWLLRMGLFQLSPLSETAEHAALNTTVELAKELHGNQVAKFCNGLLRKAQKENYPEPAGNKAIELATRYSHPVWLVRKWIKAKGAPLTIARLEENQKEAPRWLRINPLKTSVNEIVSIEDLKWGEIRFNRYIELLSPWRDFINHPIFKSGALSPQDPAAWLMTRLLELKENENCLDLCGAPGGKTSILLEELPNNLIVCSDLKHHRLTQAHQIKSRLQLDPQLVCQDATQPAHKENSFDKILVDVPCTNLGVLSRRTEARWTCTEDEVLNISSLQLNILNSASKLLKPGGIIVYGTCSPENEETHVVIQKFLNENPNFEIGNSNSLPKEYRSKDGLLELWPGEGHRLDGFFGAQLIKKLS